MWSNINKCVGGAVSQQLSYCWWDFLLRNARRDQFIHGVFAGSRHQCGTNKITDRRLYQDFGHIHICVWCQAWLQVLQTMKDFASVISWGSTQFFLLKTKNLPQMLHFIAASLRAFNHPVALRRWNRRCGLPRRVHVKAVRARAIPLSVRTWLKRFGKKEASKGLCLPFPETNIAA